MLEDSHVPMYNLKVVVRETGLKPDTLRAWERRYGLPRPERTSGGHRLYSQRDIETLKWLIARQQEGMSISRAVDLWNRLVDKGHDPLQDTGPPGVMIAPASSVQGEMIGDLREAWVTACLNFEEQAAEQIAVRASALYPPETVCLELLQKGLAEIEERWREGQADVQQERFASALATRRLEVLIAAAPPPVRTGRLIVASPSEEWHVFDPLTITFLLKRRGWDVLYLGAGVPPAQLEETVEVTGSRLVILSARQLHTAARLLELARPLAQHGILIGFGGRIFNLIPELRARIPGYFLGERVELSPQAVERILASSSPVPPVGRPPVEYERALEHFRMQQGMIEMHVWQILNPAGMPAPYLFRTGQSLSRDIMAALVLGDINLARAGIGEVEGWLRTHNLRGQIPSYLTASDLLRSYLHAYYEAVSLYLGEGPGSLIVGWLAGLLDKAGDGSLLVD